MLKFKLSKEEFDKTDDTLKAFYAADGDNFVLQAEGAADKSKLDEFRQSNVELMKKAKELEGVDLSKYKTLLETERKIRDKELIEKGDIETLIAERLANTENDYKGKLTNAETIAKENAEKYAQLLSKTEIEGAAFKAFGTAKIRPEAHEAVMAQIKSTFVVEDGKVIGKANGSILTGADGNLTIAEFVDKQPDFMRVPNTPGGAGGNDNDGAPMSKGSTSQDKIQSGLKELMNK